MKIVLNFFSLLMCLVLAVPTSAQQTVSRFSDLDDVFDFIRPMKTFNTRDGDLVISCVNVNGGEIMRMYYRGQLLSDVGWSNPNTVANGSYARLAIRTYYRQISVILHLPDADHSLPYMYFEPNATSADRELSMALGRAGIYVPQTSGWEKYEPILDGNGATVSFEPSTRKPTPSIYYMKNSILYEE